MAKPLITLRSDTDPLPLTYTELDTNFLNLRDATISLTAGSGGTQVTSDLNGNITLVAGTGVTLSGDNTAKTITINSTAGTNTFANVAVTGQTTIAADSVSDTLTVAGGGNIVLTTNATTDTLTVAVSTTPTFTSVGASTADILTIDTNVIESRVSSSNYIEMHSSTNGNDILVWGGNRGVTVSAVDGNINLNATAGGNPANININGNAIVSGVIQSSSFAQAFSVNNQTGTPANTTTITGYLKINVGGTIRYFPFYT